MSKIPEGVGADAVRQALSECASFEDVRARGFLFHGTCENIEGPIRGGAYDGVFWTAPKPSLAQAYIPRSGITSFVHRPADHERADRIEPSKWRSHALQWALEKAGVTIEDLDVTWNGQRAWSWTIPNGWPTLGEYDDFIQGLEYRVSPRFPDTYEVSQVSNADGRLEIMPADWRLPGHLLILLPDGLDIREPDWSEDGLGYTSHNRVGDFSTFALRGMHAFRMGDQLQSDHLGNVGHEAIGILPAGLERVSWLAIPAVRHDGEDHAVFRQPETPDFIAFMREINPAYGQPSAACPEPA